MGLGPLSRIGRAVGTAAAGARVFARAGLVRPVRPDRLLGMGLGLAWWGVSPAAGYAAGAARHPDRPAVIDDDTVLTYAELHRRSNAVAHGLRALGVHPGDVVALLARNSTQFVLAQVAAVKAGADVLYLNTGFSAQQVADVLRSEGVAAIVADDEFVDVVGAAARGWPQVFAWHRPDEPPRGMTTLAALSRGDDSDPPPPARTGRHVILTSGTTGRPKGAARSAPGVGSGVEAATGLLSVMPLRAGEATVVSAPMFHAWGFGHLTLGMLLGSTLVVSRRFDPEGALALIDRHRATAWAVVPVMIQRALELPNDVRDRYDLSSLRVVAASGSAIPAELASRFMDAFGDVLYNLYGSTEVAYTSLATPADMRAAPGTVGRPVAGVTVRIVDPDGRPVTPGDVGRIFVGNSLGFSGYTGGEDKERLDGLIATGDLGRFDDTGRLYVEGRSDDMIVSGGENVFPAEVEETLAAHPDVADVAVVGVPDERFGQRLVAHVVLAEGRQTGADELKAHVKRSLANYKVPREVVFHEALPRNETGKVLKRRLREEPPAGERAADPRSAPRPR